MAAFMPLTEVASTGKQRHSNDRQISVCGRTEHVSYQYAEAAGEVGQAGSAAISIEKYAMSI
jgi:hypothetical protein